MQLPRLRVGAMVLALALAGCSLPRGAALTSEILSNSSVETADIEVQTVSRDFLPELAKWPSNNSVKQYGWLPAQRGPASALIAAGDKVTVEIWNGGQDSLLSTPGHPMTRFDSLVVSPSGTIFIPFLNEIRVSKMTPQQARQAVQKAAEELVAEAQVQLWHNSGRRNSVDLVGGVRAPGTFPLPDRNFTVLGLISAGSGVDPGLNNPQIRLLRGGKTYGTSVARLYETPNLDTLLRGGDKVIIDADSRRFLTLGATGKEAILEFQTDRVSALDAISQMGGISDTRGNPKGILVLREYPVAATRGQGPRPSKQRVVFSLDLTNADGLFSAGKFEIQPNDLVLATESPVTSATTILGLIGRSIGIANQLE